LHQWLKRQIAQGGEVAESACTMVEKNLHTITSLKKLPPAIAEIVTRYAPMTAVMNQFHRLLKTESKATPYPVDELERFSD
jgi:hypothetical protein